MRIRRFFYGVVEGVVTGAPASTGLSGVRAAPAIAALAAAGLRQPPLSAESLLLIQAHSARTGRDEAAVADEMIRAGNAALGNGPFIEPAGEMPVGKWLAQVEKAEDAAGAPVLGMARMSASYAWPVGEVVKALAADGVDGLCDPDSSQVMEASLAQMEGEVEKAKALQATIERNRRERAKAVLERRARRIAAAVRWPGFGAE